MNITVDKIMSFKPCYSRKKVEDLLNGRTTLTKQDILDLDIPDRDKIWGLLREDFLSERDLHLLACEVAEHALTYVDKPDERSVKAIEAKRLWLDGKITDEELEKARKGASTAAADTDAARAAYSANAAANAAAYFAAANAAAAAYFAAANAAAAAYYAATDAADTDAVYVERRWQLNRILSHMED